MTTSQLFYQASIDIVDEARLNFDKNGIEFYKCETNALFMQVSELSDDDEFEVNHGRDRQIRAELEEVFTYKPEETESVDNFMKLVLAGETPTKF